MAVCQSQDSRQRQTVAFKGQQHHTFIKTSFNYDVDELCVSHPVQKHWMLLIENKHEACRDSSPTYSAVFSMKYGSRKAAVTFFFPPILLPRVFIFIIMVLFFLSWPSGKHCEEEAVWSSTHCVTKIAVLLESMQQSYYTYDHFPAFLSFSILRSNSRGVFVREHH